MRSSIKKFTLLTGVGANPLSSLWANGEDGFLFYPMSDLTRLFLTSVGGNSVAADADPVGLDMENHSWGATGSLAVVVAAQSELVLNGTFDTDLSSWSPAHTAPSTVIWSGGQAVWSTDGSASARIRQSIATVAGKTYRLVATGTIASNSNLLLGTTAGGVEIASGAAITAAIAAGGAFYFVALGTTTWVSTSSNVNGRTLDNVSVKLVPGNHALQATTTKRPLWKANSGKPYLNFDDTDDYLQTSVVPSTAFTIAVSGRSTSTADSFIGGGFATGPRCFLGTDGSGLLRFGWGDDVVAVGADVRNTDLNAVLTGDSSTRDLWVNGVLASSGPTANGPNGTGGGLAIGALNNNGTQQNFLGGRIYAGLALNRRATASEIALITSQFRSAYQ